MIKDLKKIRKSNFVILGILLIVYFGNTMFTTLNVLPVGTAIQNKDGNKFAGSAVCATCHKDIYESHIKTAHYLDSRRGAKEFIKGSFSAGKNNFVYNKWMKVVMEQKNDSFFQTGYINGVEYQSEPFDIVIGSGRKGQTYLYWDDDKLYELPVSYYTPLNSWCISPGYSPNFIKFDRVIPATCLECHGTYIKAAEDKDSVTIFDKSQIMYGIDCERCHGPAADHVDFQRKHPEEKTAKYIISTKHMDRQLRLDACALCHSGFRKMIKPAFSFTVGDKLDEYSTAAFNSDSTAALDVHGNQYGLLLASKCFRMSKQLDCSSCHNVHVNEANTPKIFSQRCMTCHTETTHATLKLADNEKLMFNDNCIDCHMPALPSKKIVLNVANFENVVPDMVRTHRVGIYPEQTKNFLQKIKSQKE